MAIISSSLLVEISEDSVIGNETNIDSFTVIDARTCIGSHCKIHHFVHIGCDVRIGSNVKIQDHVMIPCGVTLENGVFVGPSVVFTNDKYPRSVTEDGKLKNGSDWTISPTLIKEGPRLVEGLLLSVELLSGNGLWWPPELWLQKMFLTMHWLWDVRPI